MKKNDDDKRLDGRDRDIERRWRLPERSASSQLLEGWDDGRIEFGRDDEPFRSRWDAKDRRSTSDRSRAADMPRDESYGRDPRYRAPTGDFGMQYPRVSHTHEGSLFFADGDEEDFRQENRDHAPSMLERASHWLSDKFRGGHAGKGPKGYRRSDERIREDVCEALFHHPEVDASNIEVRVESGEVTLSGEVDSRQTKRFAENAAELVPGIHDVINRLKVQRASTETDTQL